MEILDWAYSAFGRAIAQCTPQPAAINNSLSGCIN